MRLTVISILLVKSFANRIDHRASLKSDGPPVTLEILHPSNCSMYLRVADESATEDKFRSWEPTGGWTKNPGSVRYTTFKEGSLYASPGADGLISHKVEASEPWSPRAWIYLANTCPSDVKGGCYPEECNEVGLPMNGSIRYTEISKCHKLTWKAGQAVMILEDPWKNKYVMHASSDRESAAAGVAFGNPALPEGWHRSTVVLETDIAIAPVPADPLAGQAPAAGFPQPFGTYPCGYAQVHDSAGTGHHRYETTNGNAEIRKLLQQA